MPRRKPASERQNRETRDIGLLHLTRHGMPAAPKVGERVMLAPVRESWEKFWRSDIAGAVLEADMPALIRLWSLYDMRERMLRAYMRKPFETGSTGQLVVHPAAREMASLDKRILPLEDHFGITPHGRLTLGIALGAASKSLEEMNRAFEDDPDESEDADPRKGGNIHPIIEARAD